jgi:hypothetical protein
MSQHVISCIKPKFWKHWFSFVHVVIQESMIHIQMRLCFTFLFNYTFKFNYQLNNTLLMFWKMNIKIYIFFDLQIVLNIVNFNILFHVKEQHVLIYFKWLNHILHSYILWLILRSLIFIIFIIPTIWNIEFKVMVAFDFLITNKSIWNFIIILVLKLNYWNFFNNIFLLFKILIMI